MGSNLAMKRSSTAGKNPTINQLLYDGLGEIYVDVVEILFGLQSMLSEESDMRVVHFLEFRLAIYKQYIYKM